jgi:hypothetical protein
LRQPDGPGWKRAAALMARGGVRARRPGRRSGNRGHRGTGHWPAFAAAGSSSPRTRASPSIDNPAPSGCLTVFGIAAKNRLLTGRPPGRARH